MNSMTVVRWLLLACCALVLDAQSDLHRTEGDGTVSSPVEAPLRLRLWNARSGDPRRKVGELLTPEDLDQKVRVDQTVYGKNIGTGTVAMQPPQQPVNPYEYIGYKPQKGHLGSQWRSSVIFDPFARGEIVALRRGEIIGVMDAKPALCLKRNSWRDCSYVTSQNKECIRTLEFCHKTPHSDPSQACPTDQRCLTYKHMLEDGCIFTQGGEACEQYSSSVATGTCDCAKALVDDAKNRAEVNNRTIAQFTERCGGVEPGTGWQYNWCQRVSKVWSAQGMGLRFNISRPPWDPLAIGEYREPSMTAPVCVGQPELLCHSAGYCVPKHCKNPIDGMPTRYSEKAVRKASVNDLGYDFVEAPEQVAGTLEMPYAGVDYYRDDTVREIRYGEFVSYSDVDKRFKVIVRKRYNPPPSADTISYGEWQRERRPAAAEGQWPSNIKPNGSPRSDTLIVTYASLPAERVFQLWGPVNQAALSPNADGKPKLFDGTKDIVVMCSTVDDLLAAEALNERLHILLAPGDYWLNRPLKFASSRVHISGYQDFSELIMPSAAWASSTYSRYNHVNNTISAEGLTNTEVSLEIRRRAERARGVGLVTRASGHDKTSVHDNQRSAGTMWQSAGGTVVNEWLEFDLGKNWNLTHIFLWNMNQDKVAFTRSLKDVVIQTSSAVPAGSPPGSAARRPTLRKEWFAVTPSCKYWDKSVCPDLCAGPCGETISAFTFKPGTGDMNLRSQTIVLGGAKYTQNVRWVRMDIRSAWGGGMRQFVGMSEIRFGGQKSYQRRPRIIGGHNGRLVTIPIHYAMKFSDVILRHGVVDGTGGIVNNGTLIVYNSTLESNASYAWDGGSWRSGGVAIYNRGNAFLDLCDLIWDFSGTTSPSGHPEHKETYASQGATSFIGLLARRIGLVRASGGMLYNMIADPNDAAHKHSPLEKGGDCKQIDCSRQIPKPTPDPVPGSGLWKSANISIDRCKFEGDKLSPRLWDDLGEATPWWCNFNHEERLLKRLKNGLTTGVLDGSEGPPFGSHLDVGGGMERGGSPIAGFLRGGDQTEPTTGPLATSPEYTDAVQKHSYDTSTRAGEPLSWAGVYNTDYRWDIGAAWEVGVMRICRVVDGDSVVLCDEVTGDQIAVRLTGVAVPSSHSCQVYYSGVTEKAFEPSTLRCSDAEMKKRAELGALWLARSIGRLVKLELMHRYMPFGENVGRVTVLEGEYKSLSLSDELLRLGYVVRLAPLLM